MAMSAWLGIAERGIQNAGHGLGIISLFALGGALAYPPGLLVARFLSGNQHGERAFAAMLLSFGVCTAGITGLCYVVIHSVRHVDWQPGGSAEIWAFRIAFTILGALYEFAALGMRMYVPIGLAALFIVAAWHARR